MTTVSTDLHAALTAAIDEAKALATAVQAHSPEPWTAYDDGLIWSASDGPGDPVGGSSDADVVALILRVAQPSTVLRGLAADHEVLAVAEALEGIATYHLETPGHTSAMTAAAARNLARRLMASLARRHGLEVPMAETEPERVIAGPFPVDSTSTDADGNITGTFRVPAGSAAEAILAGVLPAGSLSIGFRARPTVHTEQAPARDVVAQQMHRLLCLKGEWSTCNTHGIHWHDADVVLGALADAGYRLLPSDKDASGTAASADPDGGETRTEWAVEMTDAEGGQVALAHRTEFDYRTTPTWSESIAQGMVREARRHSPPARVVRRTVHVGPWEPAP